jgi:hypothetical protein
LTAISAKRSTGRRRAPSSLLKTSSTLARPAGLRWPMPLKITSCIDSPRSSLALLSPSTQRTASMTLDFAAAVGADHADALAGQLERGGSAKDLKPESLIWFRRIESNVRAARMANGSPSMPPLSGMVCAVASRTRVPTAAG